jgi:hypothetical protein
MAHYRTTRKTAVGNIGEHAHVGIYVLVMFVAVRNRIADELWRRRDFAARVAAIKAPDPARRDLLLA